MFVNHVHLLPAQVREDATLGAFDRLAQQVGIQGAVCFAPFTYQVESLGLEPNIWLQDAIGQRSELVGYGTLSPAQEPKSHVKRIADLGFRGIKLHPPAQKFEIFGAWARAAYEAMEELGLIADFHLGVHWHRLKDYDPLLCDEIAYHFPQLRMVFEHVGGWHYYRQVLAVITNNMARGNHLYAGIASVLDRDNQRYWYLGTEGLNDCRWQIGEDLLIYGLDFPYNQAPQIERDLNLIREMNWPEEAVQGLLGGNLKRLLGMETGQIRIVGGDPNPVT